MVAAEEKCAEYFPKQSAMEDLLHFDLILYLQALEQVETQITGYQTYIASVSWPMHAHFAEQ